MTSTVKIIAGFFVVIALIACQKADETPRMSMAPKRPTLQTSNGVVDAKVYTSTLYGFTFSYPADWILKDEPGLRETMGMDIVFDIGTPGTIEGIRVDAAEGATVEGITAELLKTSPAKVTDIMLDGKQGKRIVTLTDGLTIVAVLHNDKIYQFLTGGFIEEDGVLPSFRFLR